MFLIERNEELTPLRLGKILQAYQTQERPKLEQYRNYYLGKQKIMSKTSTDPAKEYNKVVTNYCANIVDTYNGYLTGIDVSYASDENLDDVIEVLNYNDVHSEDSDLLKDALIYGCGCELCYIDEDGKQRFKTLDPRECIDVYDDTITQNLMYAIRYYSADYINETSEDYFVEVYDKNEYRLYKSNSGFSSFKLIEQRPHFFKQVPMTFFYLNNEHTNIFNQIMTLQDAYNELVSGEIDDFDAFADAYLVLKGITADEDDLVSMKKNKVLMMDTDADASYLTKTISDTQVQNILTNLNDNIHKIANSPDFNNDKFWANSGIALRYKLVGFENAASNIEAHMRKALQKRLELICGILNLKGEDAVWRDVQIKFTRNLPQNVEETTNMVNGLRGLVSNKTLLSQIPFVADVDAELEQLAAEKEEAMSMYSFASGSEVEDNE